MIKHPSQKPGGFTLIEIIVVVAIIGTLAGIGGANLVWMVEKSRAAEANNILLKSYAGFQRRILDDETRAIYTGGGQPATAFGRLGMADPNTLPQRYFNYTFTGIIASVPDGVNATRRGNTSRWIWINLTTGQIIKTFPY